MVSFDNIYFLCGIKYSGEQILNHILLQNPQIKLNIDSKVFGNYFSVLKTSKFDGNPSEMVFQMFNLPRKETAKVIIDHCYGWANIDALQVYKKEISDNVKIIAVVNNPTESAAHIVKNHKPQNLNLFLKFHKEIQELKASYALIRRCYEQDKSRIKLIEGKNIFNNPKQVIKDIHKYLGLDDFEYDYSVMEFVEKVDAKSILGEFYDDFDQEIFWDTEEERKKPIKELDLQLKYAIEGNFEEAIKLVNKLEIERPNSDRAAFNRAWFKMRDGKLLEGHHLLDRGRIEGVFGSNFPDMTKPVWDGVSKGKVLCVLEGGFGDQIHAMKYLDKVKNICGDITIACSKELMGLIANNFTNNIIDSKAYAYCYCDYWVPMMSIISILGYEYKDLSGAPYFKRLPKKGNKFRIGLKWSGNPEFEHEQHRKFPVELFFDSVKGLQDIEYVSLQRDEEKEKRPDWVKEVKLDSWEDTQREISQCDLVISSCTSIAHFSGAIGVPTWIIIPVLPYYLWALPGEKTPHYDSVTLFRQENFKDWSAPLRQVGNKLKNLL